MATRQQNYEFTDSMLGTTPLNSAIEWIANNLAPEDVFDSKQLEAWAAENDFVKAEE